MLQKYDLDEIEELLMREREIVLVEVRARRYYIR